MVESMSPVTASMSLGLKSWPVLARRVFAPKPSIPLAPRPCNSYNNSTVMTDEEKTQLQDRTNILRQELKQWEKEFAANNGGKKAGREDIKANANIGTGTV